MKFGPSSELKFHCFPDVAIRKVVNVDVSIRERFVLLGHSYTTLLIITLVQNNGTSLIINITKMA